MINKKDMAICQAFRRRLVERVRILDCKLFGSRARGDAEDDSDFDIYVEIENNDERVDRIISDVAWEVGFENEAVITTIVYSHKELEEGPMRKSLLYLNVVNEGIPIEA